jgi:surfeit locus 1 family protein
LIALAVFIVLVALGTWQLQRKAWKEALIDTLTSRLAAAPIDLPPREQWTQLNAGNDEFRRVRLRGEFEHDREALVYASGSALRSDVTGPGYWVFSPARLAEGSAVMVNRGFVPEGRQDPRTRADGQNAGPVEIVGVLRWPELRPWFIPGDDPSHNLWFTRDHRAIAAAKGLDVGSFYIDQEAPAPPGGLPRPGPMKANLRNDHLQYAFTWYGLAAVLVILFALWAERRRHGGKTPSL